MSSAAAAKKKTTVTKPLKRRVKRSVKLDPAPLPDSPVVYPEMMTVKQWGKYTQRHPLTIYREIADGTIPSYCYIRFGPKTIRVFKSQLDKYMAAKSAAGAR